NNAVSRTAALLAVAVFGVLMLNAFNKSLDERLRAAPISAEARAQIAGQSGDLINLKIPDGLGGEAQAAIRQAIRESFVAGFRLVAFVAAGLAAASALASWLLIEGQARREYETAVVS
ncbi:MAG TPA: MFS transporter, partial [Blastocatellia bacterium]|nr:MFS transporter [Blastocatellia bacterium]